MKINGILLMIVFLLARADMMTADESTIDGKLGQVEQMINGNDSDGAMKLLKKMIKSQPDDWKLHSLLGNLYMLKGDNASAAKCYNDALNLAPAEPDIYNNLGLLEMQRGNGEAAINNFLLTINLMPGHSSANYNVGKIYYAQNKPAEAEKYFTKVLAENPFHVLSLYHMAHIRQAEGKVDEAKVFYKKAIAADPLFDEAKMDFGTMLVSAGRLDEAVSFFKSVSGKTSDPGLSLLGLALISKAQGNKEEALGFLQEAAKASPKNHKYLVEQTVLYLDIGGKDAFARGEKCLKSAAKLAGKDGQPVYMLAALYDDNNIPEKAIDYYDEAIDLNYNVGKAKIFKAMALIKIGKNRDAEKVLNDVLKTMPQGGPYCLKAQELLKSISK